MTLVELSRASAIYGLGFFVLFCLFALLYRHAYKKRAELGLTPLEVFDVKMFAGHHIGERDRRARRADRRRGRPVGFAPIAPTCFALMGPLHWWFGMRVDKRRRTLLTPRLTPDCATVDCDCRLATGDCDCDWRLTTADCRLSYAQQR